MPSALSGRVSFDALYRECAKLSARSARLDAWARFIRNPRVVQLGAVWLAKATGSPLMPFHAEAASSWTMKRWDRSQTPEPFTTVAMAIAEPLYVPQGAEGHALEEWRSRLQASLADCRQKCAELLRG